MTDNYTLKPYKNLDGNSGVIAYESGIDYIKIQFTDGSIYLYNYSSNGKNNIEEMKKLAENGKGLSTFITKYIKKKFATKLN